MSPSERRKTMWSKKTIKRQSKWQKIAGKKSRTGHIVVGLTEGIDMVYVQVISNAFRTGKVYMDDDIDKYQFLSIVTMLARSHEIETPIRSK